MRLHPGRGMKSALRSLLLALVVGTSGALTVSPLGAMEPLAQRIAHTDLDKSAASSEPKADDKTADVKDDQQKAPDEWKKKIAQQKDQIDLLSRELDVLQREYRLRAAAFYADAGNRLRNSGTWDKEDATYKQQIDQKQKALADAKQQLDDMQEQARKSGVPSSMRE